MRAIIITTVRSLHPDFGPMFTAVIIRNGVERRCVCNDRGALVDWLERAL